MLLLGVKFWQTCRFGKNIQQKTKGFLMNFSIFENFEFLTNCGIFFWRPKKIVKRILVVRRIAFRFTSLSPCPCMIIIPLALIYRGALILKTAYVGEGFMFLPSFCEEVVLTLQEKRF
jgi:hypothetical protein